MPVMFPYIGAAVLSVVTATLTQCAVVPLIEERIFNEEKFKQLSIDKARRRDSMRRISMSVSDKYIMQLFFYLFFFCEHVILTIL